jgi:ATPase family associated with various cellular activities (AAA)
MTILSQNQQSLLEKIEPVAQLVFMEPSAPSPIKLRTHTLIAGPSGMGKTYIVEELARRMEAELFKINVTNWQPLSAGSKTYELSLIINWLFKNKNRKTIIAFDELDKIYGASDWIKHIQLELHSVLDGRIEDNAFGPSEIELSGKDLILQKLRQTLIVGMGAWQTEWQPKTMGFNSSDEPAQTMEYSQLTKQIPPEVIQRFRSELLYLPRMTMPEYDRIAGLLGETLGTQAKGIWHDTYEKTKGSKEIEHLGMRIFEEIMLETRLQELRELKKLQDKEEEAKKEAASLTKTTAAEKNPEPTPEPEKKAVTVPKKDPHQQREDLTKSLTQGSLRSFIQRAVFNHAHKSKTFEELEKRILRRIKPISAESYGRQPDALFIQPIRNRIEAFRRSHPGKTPQETYALWVTDNEGPPEVDLVGTPNWNMQPSSKKIMEEQLRSKYESLGAWALQGFQGSPEENRQKLWIQVGKSALKHPTFRETRENLREVKLDTLQGKVSWEIDGVTFFSEENHQNWKFVPYFKAGSSIIPVSGYQKAFPESTLQEAVAFILLYNCNSKDGTLTQIMCLQKNTLFHKSTKAKAATLSSLQQFKDIPFYTEAESGSVW